MSREPSLNNLGQDCREGLDCGLSYCQLPAFPHEVCLVVSMQGHIGSTDGSERDYGFLHEMIGKGISACNPATLILDFAGLSFQPCDLMLRVLDRKIPTKVIVSDLSRDELIRLFRDVLFLDPQAELFESMSDALNACDLAYQDYIRSGRKRTIAADF